MADPKPPNSKGQVTGFPYSILWEEFAEMWVPLGDNQTLAEKYAKLLSIATERGHSRSQDPTLDQIRSVLELLELPDIRKTELAEELYRLAAAYRTPRLRRELGLGAPSTKVQLKKLASAANKFAEALESVDLTPEVVLGFIRAKVADPTTPSLFNFKQLQKEARDLAQTATVFASEIPSLPQGNSVDILQIRLIKAASNAIGNAAGEEIWIKQSDTAGRNPRPNSRSADALFRFLDLIDQTMTDRTKVRLLLDYNEGPLLPSWEELTKPLPPKSWRKRRSGQL